MKALARHHLVEYWGLDPRRADSSAAVLAALRALFKQAPLSPVKLTRHHFSPRGLSVLCVLKESHLAFSSWPEHGYATLSLELCGKAPRLEPALAAFGRALGARGRRRRALTCALPPTAGRAARRR